MMPHRFCRYEFRTTAPDQAQAFYTDVLGPELWGPDVFVSALPEAALARGARPHWLGHIGVDDVEGMSARIVGLGGQRLGPTRQGDDGVISAALRDPFGAIMAVATRGTRSVRPVVAWHLLHVKDHEPAFATYAQLFGWTAGALHELGPDIGQHQTFTWDESGASAGSVSNAARRPQVHVHWLFNFQVPDVEAAVAKVRARGGKAWGPMPGFDGALIAACDDPQGAAFALFQRGG